MLSQALIRDQGFSFSPQLVTTTPCKRKFGKFCLDGSHISRGGVIAGKHAAAVHGVPAHCTAEDRALLPCAHQRADKSLAVETMTQSALPCDTLEG